jgi:hypothetical protein
MYHEGKKLTVFQETLTMTVGTLIQTTPSVLMQFDLLVGYISSYPRDNSLPKELCFDAIYLPPNAPRLYDELENSDGTWTNPL